MVLGAPINVLDYGADATGATDSSAAIQAAFNAGSNIYFPNGTYLINTAITKTANNVTVDFGNATIVNGGADWTFVFGTAGDTASYTGLSITGGKFIQSNPATTSNLNYIKVAGTSQFSIKNCRMSNVSNGGIYVHTGCSYGLIDGVQIIGSTAYSTIRAIWLVADTATGFSQQYVDTNSITRNSTPTPSSSLLNISVTNCQIYTVGLGIYCENAANLIISDNYIDIGTSGGRCIALNPYAPNAIVSGNTLTAQASGTGILVTQISTDTIISNNTFKGNFGGGRDIYVAYLSTAVISDNTFNTLSTSNIQIDMGGFAVVQNNSFVRPSIAGRAVYITTVDSAGAGGTIGSTATVLANSGVIFKGNTLNTVGIGVLADMSIAPANANLSAVSIVQVTDNTMLNWNRGGGDFPCIVTTGSTANNVNVRFERNVVLPYTIAHENRVFFTGGTAYIYQASQTYNALFNLVTPALTATKLAGANFSLGASTLGSDLVLASLTQLGSAGAVVAPPMGFVDNGGTTQIYRFACRLYSGTQYLLSAFDSTGAQINLSSASTSFNVLLGPVNNAT